MMHSPDSDTDARLRRLLDFLSEDIRTLSDEEFEKSLLAAGDDPKELAQKGRLALAKARAAANPDALAQARGQYEASLTQLAQNKLALPGSFREKLALAKACMERHHYLRPVLLTGHYRELHT